MSTVLRIIEEKCRKEKRTEFEFYQAYYSPHSGTIEATKLNLIKFESTT